MVEGDVLERAIELARGTCIWQDYRAGSSKWARFPKCPTSCPTWISATFPEQSISFAVKAILEGANMTVEDGLKWEAKAFRSVLDHRG